jgi:hypothetical protein
MVLQERVLKTLWKNLEKNVIKWKTFPIFANKRASSIQVTQKQWSDSSAKPPVR